MLAPYKWLLDYVKTDASPEELAEKMIMTGNAVEHIIHEGDNIKNVVTGKIEKIEKHPDADKLKICSINIGTELVQIVTGADNVFEGAIVPAALVGAELPNGMKIKKGKLRGVESLGMLCSGEELCITEDDYPGASVYGILILKEDTPIGVDIREILGMDDTILEFEVGANRPDCLSILGTAREAAAALDAPLSIPTPEYTAAAGDVSDYVSVRVDAPDLCPRYIARAVKNVKIQESPEWLKKKLRAAGIRPISNIVDITNFVMLETGQPMHAFDAADIRGNQIIVRRAENGEKMTTLDGKEREFNDSVLLIADAEGAIGIAGIMGGENSEIKPTTCTVVYESAKFMYGNIRQSSRFLGMSTDASMRFSKGVDAVNTEYAINRACQLTELLGAGEVVGGTIDILAEDLSPRTITTTPEKINALLGTELSAEEMCAILKRVCIETKFENGSIVCDIPSYRSDMAGYADVAEEVARIYGYDNIEAKPLSGGSASGDYSPFEEASDIMKASLINAGFYESVTYSFMGEPALDKLLVPADDPLRNAVKILNPLGNDSNLMRTTMVPGMMNVIALNINHKAASFRVFESGRVFTPTDDLPTEDKRIILAICGEDEDFYTAKGCVENTARALRIDELSFTAGGPVFLHPGRKATIYAGKKELGYMGELHPEVLQKHGINRRVYIAELRLEVLFESYKSFKRFTQLPKYPAAERDLAVLVDAGVEAGALRACIFKNGGKTIEKAELFDVYADAKLGEGKKSVAFALAFRAADRTLNDDEIANSMNKILRALDREFGAKLR